MLNSLIKPLLILLFFCIFAYYAVYISKEEKHNKAPDKWELVKLESFPVKRLTRTEFLSDSIVFKLPEKFDYPDSVELKQLYAEFQNQYGTFILVRVMCPKRVKDEKQYVSIYFETAVIGHLPTKYTPEYLRLWKDDLRSVQ